MPSPAPLAGASWITSHALCRDSRAPRSPRKSAGVARPRAGEAPDARAPGSASTAARAKLPSGTIRCLPPLPKSRTIGAPVVADDVVDVQADRLRDAGAGGVEQLEQRLVADPSSSSPSVAASSARPGRSVIAFGSRAGSFGGLTSPRGRRPRRPSSTQEPVNPASTTARGRPRTRASGCPSGVAERTP